VTVTSDAGLATDQPAVDVPEIPAQPPARRFEWLSTVDLRPRPCVLGVILVVALVMVGMAVFFGKDGAGRNPDFSPRAAVTSFLSAAKDADLPAARQVVCTGMTTAATDSVVQSLMSQLKDFHVQRTTAHGDQADVDIVLTDTDGEASGVTMLATRQGHEWKVCDLGGPTLGAFAG
jgi:hypothetical protein